MKHFIFILALFLTTSNYSYAQTSSPDDEDSKVFLKQSNPKLTPEFQRIAKKMYETEDYKAAKIDDLNKVYQLRYNIYKDQMEYTSAGKLYILKKELGRMVNFTNLNTKYQVFEMEGKPRFFIVQNDGQHSLLTKSIVQFQEARQAEDSFQQSTSADFKRGKDEIYIAFNNTSPVKVPSSKKKFFALFGDKESAIKTYMKKNKLSRKDKEDLIKVLDHYSSL